MNTYLQIFEFVLKDKPKGIHNAYNKNHTSESLLHFTY